MSLKNDLDRKDKMSLGLSLASNPKDNSFVVGVVHMIALFRYKEISIYVQLKLQFNKIQKLTYVCHELFCVPGLWSIVVI